MKKTLSIALALLTCSFIGAQAQEIDLETDFNESDFLSFETVTDQLPFQQLIGYALEVSSAAEQQQKPIGKYVCGTIFSADGYPAITGHPCEAIVHAEEGPIVVRYQNVTPEMDVEISKFIKENQLDETLRYNKGRFRFSIQ